MTSPRSQNDPSYNPFGDLIISVFFFVVIVSVARETLVLFRIYIATETFFIAWLICGVISAYMSYREGRSLDKLIPDITWGPLALLNRIIRLIQRALSGFIPASWGFANAMRGIDPVMLRATSGIVILTLITLGITNPKLIESQPVLTLGMLFLLTLGLWYVTYEVYPLLFGTRLVGKTAISYTCGACGQHLGGKEYRETLRQGYTVCPKCGAKVMLKNPADEKNSETTAAISSVEKNLDIESLSLMADAPVFTQQKAALQALSRIASVPAGPRSGHARRELFARLTLCLRQLTEPTGDRIGLSLLEVIELILPALKIMNNENVWLQEKIVTGIKRHRDQETDDVSYEHEKVTRIGAGSKVSTSEASQQLIKLWNYPGEGIERFYSYDFVSLPNTTQAWKPHRVVLQADRLVIYQETNASHGRVGWIATVVRLDRNEFLLVKEKSN